MKLLKTTWIAQRSCILTLFFLEIIIIFLFSKILNNLFSQYVRMNHLRHQNCNIEHTGMKYLKNKSKSKILKIKNSLLKLEKYFKELKDKEQKEIIKNWVLAKNWLINYASKPIINGGWCWRQNYESFYNEHHQRL